MKSISEHLILACNKKIGNFLTWKNHDIISDQTFSQTRTEVSEILISTIISFINPSEYTLTEDPINLTIRELYE